MNSNLTLYQISNEFSAILQAIYLQDGEITAEQESALSVTEANFTAKAVDYGQAILHLEAMAAAAKAEAERVKRLQKIYENTAKQLRQRITAAMVSLDHTKVETATLKLFTRKTTSTEVEDVNALPAEFKTIKIEEQANKAAIKIALQAGAEVPGCRLVENVSLQIK